MWLRLVQDNLRTHKRRRYIKRLGKLLRMAGTPLPPPPLSCSFVGRSPGRYCGRDRVGATVDPLKASTHLPTRVPCHVLCLRRIPSKRLLQTALDLVFPTGRFVGGSSLVCLCAHGQGGWAYHSYGLLEPGRDLDLRVIGATLIV